MALSMFLRAPACTSRLLSQQLRQLTTQSVLNSAALRSSAASAMQLKKVSLTPEAKPILNAVRPFQTSSIRLSQEKAHDHAKLWVIEKATAAALVPLIPLALLMPNKLLDSAVALLIVAHSFWGMEAVMVEYVRVILFGHTIPKIAIAVVYMLSSMLLGGLFYLIFNDIGMSRAFLRIWQNMAQPKDTVSVIRRGLEAIAVDYVRASIFGPVIPKIAIALVYLLSFATIGGLFYIITHDIGIANTVRQFWAIKSEQKA